MIRIQTLLKTTSAQPLSSSGWQVLLLLLLSPLIAGNFSTLTSKDEHQLILQGLLKGGVGDHHYPSSHCRNSVIPSNYLLFITLQPPIQPRAATPKG